MILAKARTARVVEAIEHCARYNKIVRMHTDHGSLIATRCRKLGEKPGTVDEYIAKPIIVVEMYTAAVMRMLQHFDPAAAAELIRGYELARAAGLLTQTEEPL